MLNYIKNLLFATALIVSTSLYSTTIENNPSVNPEALSLEIQELLDLLTNEQPTTSNKYTSIVKNILKTSALTCSLWVAIDFLTLANDHQIPSISLLPRSCRYNYAIRENAEIFFLVLFATYVTCLYLTMRNTQTTTTFDNKKIITLLEKIKTTTINQNTALQAIDQEAITLETQDYITLIQICEQLKQLKTPSSLQTIKKYILNSLIIGSTILLIDIHMMSNKIPPLVFGENILSADIQKHLASPYNKNETLFFKILCAATSLISLYLLNNQNNANNDLTKIISLTKTIITRHNNRNNQPID